MMNFEYIKRSANLLTSDNISVLARIHEFRGEQNLFVKMHTCRLDKFQTVANMDSVASSNRIEGISVTEERLKKIIMEKEIPISRGEYEIAGYRDALHSIQKNYECMPISAKTIMFLHAQLYKYTGENYGGKYKDRNNVITEQDADGNAHVRFKPLEYSLVPEAIDQICDAYNQAIQEGTDPLLVMPLFILDFLCIHPFKDGNGRMSRLLTLLMLYKSNYTVGKYISVEKQIENSKSTYYEALWLSSQGWHENSNCADFFVSYYLGVIISSCREFSQRIEIPVQTGISKPERIERMIHDHLGRISKSEIMKQCPDISQTTVQRTLTDLTKKEKIRKIGGGRYTYYVWNWENEL